MFQVFSVCMTCRMILYTLLFSSLEKWYCLSLFCQGCWYFRNRIASLRLRQALTLVYFPSSVLSLLSGQKRWPSCLWFWVIWMLQLITPHQISLVRLSYAFLNVSLHQTHIFNVWIVSSHLPAASHWLVDLLCVQIVSRPPIFLFVRRKSQTGAGWCLRWRSLCHLSLNAPSLSQFTTITCICIHDISNTTARRASPR